MPRSILITLGILLFFILYLGYVAIANDNLILLKTLKKSFKNFNYIRKFLISVALIIINLFVTYNLLNIFFLLNPYICFFLGFILIFLFFLPILSFIKVYQLK